ncbi:TolC family protein [Pseudomonas tolaasii]|uniref:TolC family protein n=1 Tax=Pseudomonas tolaasii TaxID=29442 RepID=UPI00031DDA22|nr:TolC family protein [Pseudomonas tolaasii]
MAAKKHHVVQGRAARNFLASLILVALSPLALAEVALDYVGAQLRLLERSDAIKASSAQVRNRQSLEAASLSLWLPDVSLQARYLRFQKSLNLPLGSLAPVASDYGINSSLHFGQRDWRFRPLLNVSMSLYSGGKISAAQSTAAASRRQAEADREGQVGDQLMQLAQAYFGQSLARQAVAVRRQALEGLERHLKDAKKLEQGGMATRAQRLQAQVARDQARRDYEQALANVDTVQQVLAYLLRSPTVIETSDPLFVYTKPIESLESFQRAALRLQPLLASIQAKGDVAREGVNSARADLKPDFYLFGQYDMKRNDGMLTEPDWIVGIGMEYKLFSSQNRPRRISAAQAQVDEVDATLQEARTHVMMGVTRAWNQLSSASKQFMLLASSLAEGEENLRLQILSFREGQSTSLDVINAQMGLARARIERVQAAYQYDTALAELLHISGQSARFSDFQQRADQVLSHD